MNKLVEGALRIWHITNLDDRLITGGPRYVYHRFVSSPTEAKLVLDVLAYYDLSLGLLIDSNAQGLEVFKDGEWSEWYDPETDLPIEEWGEDEV